MPAGSRTSLPTVMAKAGQQSLLDAGRYRPGAVERYASEDLRELRRYKALAPGMKALEAGYRHAAREVDRAEHDPDGSWKKMAALRELRHQRERLGILIPVLAGEEADAFWSSVSTPVRD